MPKLFASLDGYFETTDRSIAWANLSDDFDDHSISQLNDIGTLLFGRVTYEGMEAYWTTDEAAKAYPEVHRLMNTVPKVVFSSTLDGVDWPGTTLVRDDAVATVAKLKRAAPVAVAVVAIWPSSAARPSRRAWSTPAWSTSCGSWSAPPSSPAATPSSPP